MAALRIFNTLYENGFAAPAFLCRTGTGFCAGELPMNVFREGISMGTILIIVLLLLLLGAWPSWPYSRGWGYYPSSSWALCWLWCWCWRLWDAFDRDAAMAKKKLLEDIKLSPARFYRLPGDVMRDRRFGDAERLEILRAWRDEAEAQAVAPLIENAIGELESRLPAHSDHAAE